jgi:hypothetical protein
MYNRKIDRKIDILLSITSNFIFVEFYSHTQSNMYKIINQFSKLAEDKIVLCPVSDGIEKALDLAIEQISKSKNALYR